MGLSKTKDFFIAIDSDGCVFNSMDIKQKECLCPLFIKIFNLQEIAEIARETWEFVNLYSRNRGLNRFMGLVETVNQLKQRPEVFHTSVKLPDITNLAEWVETTGRLSTEALIEFSKTRKDETIQKAIQWSQDITKCQQISATPILPFENTKKGLKEIQQVANAVVVSNSPLAIIQKEWSDVGFQQYVDAIFGQEQGKKATVIEKTSNNRFAADEMLMIGDAPGDLKAAIINNMLFYPVLHGREANSWRQLINEGLEFFINKKYKGEYQESLISEFLNHLPEKAAWQKRLIN